MPNDQNITTIPSSRVDFIDPRTGLMAREWYRYFLNLSTSVGTGTVIQPSILVPTASPFEYTNNNSYPVDIMISGGGVVKLEFTRNGVEYYDTGSYYGMFMLSPGDQLRILYYTVPNMTLIPR
jgi:hypothetical protein